MKFFHLCHFKMKKEKENISELKQFYEVEHLSLHTISCITGISTYRVAKLLKEAGVVTSRASLSSEGKAQAKKLHDEIKQLEQALKKPLPHFQLTQRFNSADGD